ncbi:hypothetical protein RKLH11_2915 [Rhodobacteraceae bacterium KLH11]|nr:hypothetical protein RKLH11_2915 [Rhodobacteraceae bacterium KLH11]
MTDLLAVTEAVFQQEHQRLRPLLEQETRLLGQLARLDAQLDEVRAHGAQADGYRITGTDLLWQGWESATRRNLNTELARLRSQKIAAMEALRVAFGRKQAVANLSRQLNDQRQRAAKP